MSLERGRRLRPLPASRACLHRVAVVAQAIARLDHDQVEAQRQVWQLRTIGQDAALEQPVRRGPDPRSLAAVHRLLGQPETPAPAPANLDDDERAWWAGIDGDEIELETTDPDVPRNDRPAGGGQPFGDPRLGGVT